MITSFIDGHSYRWIGSTNERPAHFTRTGEMDFILDKMPHKVIFADKMNAFFEGHPNRQNYTKTFCFNGHEANFEEIKI